MQLKKYRVVVSVPVAMIVDAKDSSQAISRAISIITNQGVVEYTSINYDIYPVETVCVDNAIENSATPAEIDDTTAPLVA